MSKEIKRKLKENKRKCPNNKKSSLDSDKHLKGFEGHYELMIINGAEMLEMVKRSIVCMKDMEKMLEDIKKQL